MPHVPEKILVGEDQEVIPRVVERPRPKGESCFQPLLVDVGLLADKDRQHR